MAEVVLTPQQQAVVDDRGGALLVSAAAGSGKTKVLVDRVLKCVAQEQCDLDDFLMITFSKAAASELRGKLLAQLSQELAKHPDDRHLQKQMSRVYLAQISTVHSFCTSLLREYAHMLHLPADFTVCDEQEAELLRMKAMEQVLESAYESLEDCPKITAALELLGAGRDDRKMPELILKVYFSIQCAPVPQKRVQELKDSLDFSQYEDVGQSVWGGYLIRELHSYLAGCKKSMERALSTIRCTDALAAYASGFENNIHTIDALMTLSSWDAIGNASPDFGRLSAIRKCTEPELQAQVQAVRRRVISGIRDKLSKFSISSQEAFKDLRENGEALQGLLILTERFSEAYNAGKRRRHVLDYNDLEHETLRLLVGKDNRPTAAAREIRERYVQIMVDEYQDTNAVQDTIFNAISREGKNLFFVGDVKQSIYRFRQADPTIFLEKYKTFADYAQAVEGEGRRILLSDNFRSHPAVLSAANDVFYLTMTERVGGLYYTEAEALRAKRVMPDMGSPAVELHCVDLDDIESDTPVSRGEVEAEFVARRVAQMIEEKEMIPDGEALRPIRGEDIVILLRSMSGKASVYMRALERHGIASVCAEDNLFDSDEIIVLTALLQVIDNPHQDIPLLSVLFSPVFSFSPQILAMLRGKDRKCDLYQLLEASEEGFGVVQKISRLRDAAQRSSLRELLEQMDEMLFIRAIYGSMEGGGQRLRHLERFFSFADAYESGGRFGLSGFLRHIEAMRQKGVKGELAQSKDAVRLMTVHKSKGLEFPVVFLVDLAKRFNRADSTETVLVDPVLGIASSAYDKERHLVYPTVARHAISDRIRRESLSEEIRVLYVAMTRPQYRMVMTCCGRGLSGKLKSLSRDLTIPAEDGLLEGAASIADWILMTAMTHTEAGALFAIGGNSDVSQVSPYPWRIEYHTGSKYFNQDSLRKEQPSRKEGKKLPYLVQPYPHEMATQTPAKLTATQLKGRTLDDEIAEQTQPRLPELHFPKPSFTPGGRPLSPTDRGTAIHLAMQFIRYEACVDLPGVEAELKRLLSARFLSAQQYAAVEPRKILAFFRSDVGKRVQQAENLVREFKFSILEDGAVLEMGLAGEEILLQGVTDCCLLEADGLTILDFKSDRLKPGEEGRRAEHYRGQLDAYSRALSRIFELPVKERILYFFATDSAYTI